jgi:amino acid adenylation domain-containing protein
LARLGAGQSAPVGVCVARSAHHIVALLAAGRAGAPFLPLDPAWPPARLQAVLKDAGARIVIADTARRADVAAEGRIVIDPYSPGTPAVSAKAGEPRPEPDAVAYVIYTSGSTGAPKGAEVTWANLRNLIDWHLETFQITAADRISWVAGLAFDASVWELFPALAARAQVAIPPEGARGSAEALRDWLAAARVTVAFVPTPLAEPLMTVDWPAETALRLLLTGGDALHARPRAGLPFRVVNNYGLSECAVASTSGPVTSDEKGLPTLGRPIRGTRIHILDAAGQPVGPGAAGEIFIAGAGVGKGYRGRPDLTAERFVTITLPSGPSERCYRTGDLGRWTVDGEIAFIGRVDDQVARRGHRIEPHEVSAALARHPSVAQAAVVSEGAAQLVAYVVTRGQHIPRGSDLRAFLGESLPDYMLPDVYVRLDRVPLTSNGKLDISALPGAASAERLPSAPYRAPVTTAEKRIAAMVEDLLDIDEVGLDDDFFLLGGHSLLGTQLLLRIRDAFGAELALRDLFDAQTIQNLSERVEAKVTAMVAAMPDSEVRLRLGQAELA